MSELTERYVGATLRSIPARQRDDIEAELRASVADAVEARLAEGEDEKSAERAVLSDLGDPDRLASAYTGQPGYLIGPDHFFVYRRLLAVLLVTVVPVVMAVTAVGQIIAGGDVGEVVVALIRTGVTLFVHVVFWTTLVFYFIDRSDAESGTEWTVSDLPALPHKGSIKLSDTIWGVVFLAMAIALILLSRDLSPVRAADGSLVPIFDSSMWDFWFPYLIVVLGLEIVFEIIKYRIGAWNWGLASMNLAFNALFAVPAVYLLATNQVFNPDFETAAPGASVPINAVIIGLIVIAASIDVVQAFRKAYLAR